MTISVEPKNLYREYESAVKYWATDHKIRREVTRKAAGNAYYGQGGAPNPENYYYTHSLHTKARLTSGSQNPRFTTKKRDFSKRVEGLEGFVRQWIRDTGWMTEFERCVDDMCNGGAVALVRQSIRKGYEQFDDPPHTPCAVRLPMNLWGCDPIATKYEDARFAYHVCIEIHADLVTMAEADPKAWNVDAVKRMRPENVSVARGLRVNQGIDRKEVSYVVMWVPGHRLPDDDAVWASIPEEERGNYHGTIFKLALCGPGGMTGFLRAEQAEMIAPPRPYYGPRQGPYVYEGFLDVPDEVRKSAPLIANDGQIEQLNQQERANDVISTRSKTVFAYDGLQPDASQALENALHGDSVSLPGLDTQKSTTIAIGGITADQRARALELAARVRRNLGMPDTALGEASGAATLGENQIADAHLNQITEYMDRRARRFAAEVFLRVAWFAENDSRTVSQYDSSIVLGGRGRSAQEAGIERAYRAKMVSEAERMDMLAGLPEGEDDGVSFDDLDVIVERVKQDGESLAKFQQATEWLTVFAPLVPQIAQFATGLEAFMDRAADEFGIAELADFFDAEAAREVGEEQRDAEMQAANPPREMPAPKVQAPGRTMPAPAARTGKNKPDSQAAQLRKVGGK